MKYVKVN